MFMDFGSVLSQFTDQESGNLASSFHTFVSTLYIRVDRKCMYIKRSIFRISCIQQVGTQQNSLQFFIGSNGFYKSFGIEMKNFFVIILFSNDIVPRKLTANILKFFTIAFQVFFF